VEQSQESLCQTLKQGDENRVGIMKGEKVRQEGGGRERDLLASLLGMGWSGQPKPY